MPKQSALDKSINAMCKKLEAEVVSHQCRMSAIGAAIDMLRAARPEVAAREPHAARKPRAVPPADLRCDCTRNRVCSSYAPRCVEMAVPSVSELAHRREAPSERRTARPDSRGSSTPPGGLGRQLRARSCATIARSSSTERGSDTRWWVTAWQLGQTGRRSRSGST